MPKPLSLSLFFPAYNEEANIKNTVARAVRIMEKLDADYEIIVVDDGSMDRTGAIVRQLVAGNRRIRLITHQPNRGYGGALKSGFYKATKKLIAFNDGDGQFDFSEITRFLKLIESADLVIGYRVKRAEGTTRWFLAQLLKVWDWLIFGIWFKDIDCAFKVIRRTALLRLPRLLTDTAMINTELLVKATRGGLTIAEVPVTHLPDTGDRKRRAGGGHPRIIFKAVKGTFDLWRSLRDQSQLAGNRRNSR
jgi:glycosyltransferase involved in cell wall biosynthesis